MLKVKVIAEIANAHQGDTSILYSLIKAAASSGVDGVKFQWFKYDHLATEDYSYYKSYQEMFIPENEWLNIVNYAKKLGLEVWIDIFDDWGLELAAKLASMVDGFKIPATIIQAQDIIEGIFSLQKPVLLGVGGWYEHEIDGFIHGLNKKNLENLIIIHGFQGYPTNTEDANLIRIGYLKKRYALQVGFADHEDASKQLALDLPIYAVFAGATLIEKHITLDRSKKGYDYYSALEPHEFSIMVSRLREAEPAIGTINVNESERSYLKDSLRVIAKKDIAKGEILTLNKTAYKRCSIANALMPKEFMEKAPVITNEAIKKNQAIAADVLEQPKITIAVICRLKSTRLPKKALLPINGVASIERCLLNCLAVPKVDQVILATSFLAEDDPLEQFTIDGKVKVLRGDPDNVAKRLLQAAHETGANIVLRVTGDCPAVSPEILNILIEAHLKSGGDLTVPTPEHAVGTAADVYTVESLNRLLEQKKPLTHTEYLSFYYINNPNIFSVNKVELPDEFRYPQWRLTLDEQKDLDLLEAIYSNLDIKREPLYFCKLRNYLLNNPQLAASNCDVPLKWKDNQEVLKEISEATDLSNEYELIDVAEKHKMLILNWRNSEHVRLNMFDEHVITEEEHNNWFENMKKGHKTIAKLLLWKGTPIGFVNFTDIDHENNKCYWGFYIGEKEAPKGSGTIMAILALNYIFEEFSLRKLCTEVLEFNNKSINYHKKLGFVEEGRLKNHILRNNHNIDVIVMALFRENWRTIKEQLFKEWREKSD